MTTESTRATAAQKLDLTDYKTPVTYSNSAQPVSQHSGNPASTGREDFESIAFRFFKDLPFAERNRMLQVLLGWDDKTMSQVRTHSDERRCLKRALRARSGGDEKEVTAWVAEGGPS